MFKNQTDWVFSEITFQQTRNGVQVLVDRYYAYSSDGSINDNMVKGQIREHLKDPTAVITFLHKRPIDAQEFQTLTGRAPGNPHVISL